MSTPEFEVHRAIVHSSNVSTGAAEVRIPSLLGAGQVVSVPTTGLTQTAGEWNVPTAGSSIFVAVSADRTQFLWVTAITAPTDSDIDFNDNVTIGGDLGVNGEANFNSNATVTGTLDVTGSVTVDTDTLYVDSATNSVGIGTNSPDSTLQVNGIAKTGNLTVVSTGVDDPQIIIDPNDGLGVIRRGSGYMEIYALNDAENGYDDLYLNANVTIDGSGNVGIGTDSPSAKLDVNGDVNVSGQMYSRANWCAMSGPRTWKSAYWNTWYHIAWNTGASGSVVCYPHIDTSLLEYDGIEIFREGHFLVEFGQRNNGGTYNAYGGIGESGSRTALAGASHDRGTDGIWSHDHAMNASSWIHSYYIGRLYEGDIVTAGPSAQVDANNMVFANGNYAGFLSVIYLGDHDGT